MAYPIASVPGGGTRFSDGSVRYVSLPYASSRPVVSTPAPKPSGNTGGGGGGGGNTGGGGGGGQPSSWTAPDGSQWSNPNDYYSEIENIYKPSFNYLSQAESQLRSDLPNALAEAESAYKTQMATIGQQKESALGKYGEQRTQAQERQTQSEAQIRRLYDELNRGYRQRFGGMSSAGQAASEIASAEQQRQMGATGREYQTAARTIGLAEQDVQNQYNTQSLQLEQNKQSAINQVNRDFQNKLLEINRQRGQLESEKASARLNALRELRTQIMQINLANDQFQKQLELMREQARLGINAYTSSLLSNYNTTANQVGGNIANMSVNPTSIYGAGGATSTGSTSTNQQTGVISPRYKMDENGNLVQY